jgi:hypothetical protein
MARYNLDDRPAPSGSMEPRFNPKISNTALNAKLGPNIPKIRETSDGALYVGDEFGRRRAAGLGKRFVKG